MFSHVMATETLLVMRLSAYARAREPGKNADACADGLGVGPEVMIGSYSRLLYKYIALSAL